MNAEYHSRMANPKLTNGNCMGVKNHFLDGASSDDPRLSRFLAVSPVAGYGGRFDSLHLGLRIDWLTDNFPDAFGADSDCTGLLNDWLEYVHPDDRERLLASVQRLHSRMETCCEYRLQVAQQRYRWVRDCCRVVTREHSGLLHIEGALTDITDRRLVQDRLYEREQLLRQLVETETDCVAVINTKGVIEEINPAGAALLGYSHSGEIIGSDLSEYITYSERGKVAAVSRSVLSGESSQLSLRLITRKGKTRRVEIRLAPLIGAQGRIESAVMIARDVSRQDQAETRAHFLAHYDTLTGLPNRSLFRDRLLQAMANSRRNSTLLSVMFLDIDHFKDVNDSLGHSVGDRLLKEIASRISSCTRESDTVARFGGDEFGVIQTNLNTVEDAVELAERIVDIILQPITIDGHQIHTGISIGVTLYPFEDQDADNLLKNADMAMYKAKREGRNRYQFYIAELNQMVQRRVAIERNLRLALKRDEFTLHYQPQLDLRTGQVVGVEALLRWNQPEDGQVSPGEFIPVAESSGLITEIGDWVMNEACRQAKAWQDEGLPPLRVAINLSAVQFRHKNLISNITGALESSGLDPKYLEVELTESLIMKDVETTIDTLSQLRELGIQISVDDFGTGYSSLSYLTRFPIQKIKLDQSFVRDMHKKDGAAICRTIITLGQSLDMRVMAEGVEQVEQMEFLRSQGCHEVQGYYFSRPMPGGAIRRLILQASEELRQRVTGVETGR